MLPVARVSLSRLRCRALVIFAISSHIKDWRASGYHVMLFFLTLPSIEMAIARVAERVSQGGHDIPEAVIRRRFVTGVRNFYAHYRDAVNAWAVYDNSGEKPVLTHWSENL